MSTHRTALENKVASILATIALKDEGSISSTTRLDDIGLESLDMVETAVEIEAEFGIVVPDEDMANLKTVADVVDLVQKLQRKN